MAGRALRSTLQRSSGWQPPFFDIIDVLCLMIGYYPYNNRGFYMQRRITYISTCTPSKIICTSSVICTFAHPHICTSKNYFTQKLPRCLISSDDEPTMTLNSPGSTTCFISRFQIFNSSEFNLSCTLPLSPGFRLIRLKPFNDFTRAWMVLFFPKYK